jgi:zinc and cadmium transporter
LIFFFLLDKAELYHHGHEHSHGEAHAHDHAHHDHAHDHHDNHHAQPASGGWAVLLGDSVHCFGDGILIAAAYMADLRLGLAATLAVLVHEVPHHMGDLVVLRQSHQAAGKALAKLSAAGAVTVIGGVLGYLLVDQLSSALPYLLVIASSSFIYVALADLIPQLQKRLTLRETVAQVAWLAAGMGLVMLIGTLVHGH